MNVTSSASTMDPLAMHTSTGKAGQNSDIFTTTGSDTSTALAPYNHHQANPAFTNSSNVNNNISSGNNANALNPFAIAPMSPSSAQSAAAAFNLDPSILQTTIGSLLQSPAAAQMFLSSLNNSVQGQQTLGSGPLTPLKAGYGYNPQAQAAGQGYGAGGQNSMVNGQNGQNTQTSEQTNQGSYFNQAFSPNSSFTNAALGGTEHALSNSRSNQNGSNVTSNNMFDDPTLALLSPLPLPNHDALLDNQNQLLKVYQDAAGMEGDMGQLQESIDQLVRSMGLDVPVSEYPAYGQGVDGGDIKVKSEPMDDPAAPLASVDGSKLSDTKDSAGPKSTGYQQDNSTTDTPLSLSGLPDTGEFTLPEGFDMDAFLNNMDAAASDSLDAGTSAAADA